MKKLIVVAAAFAAACFSATWTYADDNGTAPGARRGRGGFESVDGKVLDYDVNARKLAVEVEVEPKKTQVMIFLLDKDAQIRKAEHALALDDLRKGITVTVTFKPADKDKKGDLPLATYIRVWENRNDNKGGPGGGPGGGGPGGRRHP